MPPLSPPGPISIWCAGRWAIWSMVRISSTSWPTMSFTRFSTTFPGWPRIIQGRADLMARFRGYGDNIELQSADRLVIHGADNGHVVVI